jgi:dihydroorotate dehydrogenase (fumarate)
MPINLTTRYLGLNLRTPLVPAASPLSEDLDDLRRMEDAGAAAVVFHSIFEEQIREGDKTFERHYSGGMEDRAEVAEYFPKAEQFSFSPDRYLEKLTKAKQSLGIPIIASLNGSSFGGWLTYAREIAQAGADALELNIYSIPTSPELTAEDIELGYISMVASLKAQLKIPLSLKLPPFFTNFGRFAHQLDHHGVDGLVLFNRFFQPDVDIESRRVAPTIDLTNSTALRLPLRWIAILSGRIKASLAATSGVQNASDVIKLVMAGADVTMLCSVLLRQGIEHLSVIERELREWLERHGIESLAEIHGCLSQKNCPDPSAFERAQYMRALAVDRVFVNNA